MEEGVLGCGRLNMLETERGRRILRKFRDAGVSGLFRDD